MDIQQVNMLLSKGPCIIEGDELNALLLDDIKVIEDPLNFEIKLDDLRSLISKDKIIIKGSRGRISRRIPLVKIDNPIPNKTILNIKVCEHYELAKSLLPKQSEISSRVLQVPTDETTILIVVDGLSFHDAKTVFDCNPMLVDGITLTKNGILRIIGDPTIAERMYRHGIKKIFGYCYWSREEKIEITAPAFAPIPPEDLYVYEYFDQVIEDLYSKDISRSYIQIFVAGLDEICHKFRDYPPIESTLKKLSNNLSDIEKVCKEKEIRSTIFLTSDHGILWKIDNKLEIINDNELKEGGPRYTKGKVLRDKTITHEGSDAGYTSLKYPYITTTLRRNEWGVHGGTSYEENVIPWVTRVVC